jgi:hypothetical protein
MQGSDVVPGRGKGAGRGRRGTLQYDAGSLQLSTRDHQQVGPALPPSSSRQNTPPSGTDGRLAASSRGLRHPRSGSHLREVTSPAMLLQVQSGIHWPLAVAADGRTVEELEMGIRRLARRQNARF